MRKLWRGYRIPAIMLILCLCIQCVLLPNTPIKTAYAAAESSKLVITGYTVYRNNNVTTSVAEGNMVQIVVSLKSSSLTANQIGGAAGITATKVLDSFRSGDKPTVQITSEPDAALEF